MLTASQNLTFSQATLLHTLKSFHMSLGHIIKCLCFEVRYACSQIATPKVLYGLNVQDVLLVFYAWEF